MKAVLTIETIAEEVVASELKLSSPDQHQQLIRKRNPERLSRLSGNHLLRNRKRVPKRQVGLDFVHFELVLAIGKLLDRIVLGRVSVPTRAVHA